MAAINRTWKSQRGDEERYQVLNTWAQNVVKRWIKEMETQQVSPYNPDYTGGSLIRSFYYKIYNASGGDQTKILFVLNNYGRHVDIGVGRGQKYDASRLADPFRSGKQYQKREKGKRTVKPFLMPIFKQRVYSLARILERKWGETAQVMIFQELTRKHFNLS
ncbi:MAG: hypothetical protein LUE98_11815 [Tannerellaceae bacterium]|nr:hypothetical protein [Tannerellaceae bacterium]